jgi:hypothetical protein
MNPVHTLTAYLLGSTLIISSHLCLNLLSGLIPSAFRTKLSHVPHLTVRATFTHLILFNLITLRVIVFGDNHRLINYS